MSTRTATINTLRPEYLGNGEWACNSETKSGVFYTIREKSWGLECNCDAGRNHRACKHANAIEAQITKRNETKKQDVLTALAELAAEFEAEDAPVVKAKSGRNFAADMDDLFGVGAWS